MGSGSGRLSAPQQPSIGCRRSLNEPDWIISSRWRSPNRGYSAELDGNLDLAISIFSDLGWDEQVGEYESTRIHLATLLCDGNDPDGASRSTRQDGRARGALEEVLLHRHPRLHRRALRRDPEEVRALMARFVEDPSVAPDQGDDDAYLIAILALKVGISPAEVRPLLDSVPDENKQSFDHDPALEPAVEERIAGCRRAPMRRRWSPIPAGAWGREASSAAATSPDSASCLPTACWLWDGKPRQSHMREAWRLFERWPGWLADETLALLRRLGVGQEVEGPKTLTSREREVAACWRRV